jgi:hypothetical protein
MVLEEIGNFRCGTIKDFCNDIGHIIPGSGMHKDIHEVIRDIHNLEFRLAQAGIKDPPEDDEIGDFDIVDQVGKALELLFPGTFFQVGMDEDAMGGYDAVVRLYVCPAFDKLLATKDMPPMLMNIHEEIDKAIEPLLKGVPNG